MMSYDRYGKGITDTKSACAQMRAELSGAAGGELVSAMHLR